MLQLTQYIPLVRAAVPRFAQYPPNPNQIACVEADPQTPLQILAGPGSGKTTVLVLRALRFVFVDGLMPENIVVTTFTRKAAEEIRSRLIEWGLAILEHLRGIPSQDQRWLDSIDISRFVTGTLDSLCEDTLTTFRDPGDPPPVLVEGFVGNVLLAQKGMFPAGARNNPALEAYLAQFTSDLQPPRNFGETVDLCRTVIDRIIQDRVDTAGFSAGNPHGAGRQAVVASLQTYRQFMAQTNRMDFAGLEEVFLDRLRQGRLQRFVATVRSLLVDEYQDTNPLQESIYFELTRLTRASISVVGDDDQSLYRFRGATVELFCDFAPRAAQAIPAVPATRTVHLVDNYRSTPEIVAFVNGHIASDPAFAGARVQPPKPQIVTRLPSNQLPIVGMFRDDCQALARDLAGFLYDVFRGNGFPLAVAGHPGAVVRHAEGDFADAVFVSRTVNEFASRYGPNPPRERLPRLLRRELQHRGVHLFNPRGRALRDIPEVQVLLGLVLECVDPPVAGSPDGAQQSGQNLRADARHYLREWRVAARGFVGTNPTPTVPHTLGQFVRAWQTRTSQVQALPQWPNEWPILELCYKLITWLPFFQDDPEGQVYLEAISRCVAQASTFSPYRSSVLHGLAPHDDHSISAAIWNIMVPLSEKAVEVDEEIMPHIPRGRLPVMTIHQAKGLEFPLVVVDVASDFRKDSPQQRFARFPDGPTQTQLMEDDVAPFCAVGPLRQVRSATARTFDDLIRLYYVGYSRAQSLLMLVGLRRCLAYNTTIKHVATSWRSDSTWAWRHPVTGRAPVLVNGHPLLLI